VHLLVREGACIIVRHSSVCLFSHVTKHGDGVFGTTFCWFGLDIDLIGLNWIDLIGLDTVLRAGYTPVLKTTVCFLLDMR